MSHRDPQLKPVRLNASCLKVALNGMLWEVVWSGVSFWKDCTWTPRLLAAAALVRAWADESTLVERWTSTRRLVTLLSAPVQPLAESYQAFTKRLVRRTALLILCLAAAAFVASDVAVADGAAQSVGLRVAEERSTAVFVERLANGAEQLGAHETDPSRRLAEARSRAAEV